MSREGQAKVLSEAEFKRVLLIAKEGQFGIRNIALLYCAFGLGLRVKEIASLTLADVTDGQFKLLDEINLKRSMTKGEKQRQIYLVNKKVRDALDVHLKTVTNQEQALQNKPLFTTQRKSRFTPNSLQKLFKVLFDKAGIIGASSHSGRRTFITRLIEHGADIKAVSKLAGHSNIVTTAIYVQDNPDRLKRIANMALL